MVGKYIFIWLFILVYGFNLHIYTCMPRQETYEYDFALRNEYLNISIIYQQDHFCDILRNLGLAA